MSHPPSLASSNGSDPDRYREDPAVPLPRQTVFIGIDPSTKYIAAVAIDADDRVCASLSGLGREAWRPIKQSRAHDALLHFLGMIQSDARGSALVEAPLVGRGGAWTTIVQGFVTGVLLDQLVRAANGFEVDLINASKWRAELGVSGRGTDQLKTNVAFVIERDHPAVWRGLQPWLSGRPDADQNLIDACGISLVGRLRGLRSLGPTVDAQGRMSTKKTPRRQL